MPYVEYDEVSAVCSECGRIFRSEESLESHRAESHEVEDVTRRPASRPGVGRSTRSKGAQRPG